MWIVKKKQMQLGFKDFQQAYRLAVVLSAGLQYQFNHKHSAN
jgi:hypothetical protein